MASDSTIVLVHGAWHGSWCWRAVLDRLGAAGVRAVAVDNPSVTNVPSGLHADADNLRDVLDAIDTPVVLVGHSYGGAVITDAGAHDAVEHVVYLTAFMLDEGESVAQNSIVGGENNVALNEAISFETDVMTIKPEFVVPVFFHDCDPAVAQAAHAQLRPQSLAAMSEATRAAAWRDRASTYIVCTDDRALVPAFQRQWAARAEKIIELPTSHSPFLSRPDALTEILVQLSR